jgi:cysteine-rich repeat protein
MTTTAVGSSGEEVLYLRDTDCTSMNDLACSNLGTRAREVAVAPMTAGQVVYAFVEDTGSSTFDLEVRALTCGDGVLVPPEECDDGNLVSGDGCSAGCLAEVVPENERESSAYSRNDTPWDAENVLVGWTYTGTLVVFTSGLVDWDYFAFNAIAGTTYTFETFTGSIGNCIPNVQYAAAQSDTVLAVLNAARQELATDDDGGLGPVHTCSKLTWTAPSTGRYYVRVGRGSNSPGYQNRITYWLQLRTN